MPTETREKKSSITSDPYAGQYPPPPPLTQNDLNIQGNHQVYQQQQLQQQRPFYIIDPSSSSNQRNSISSSSKRPSFHEDSAASSNHSIQDQQRGQYYETTNSSHNNITDDGDYDDPEAVNLKEYLHAERQEKLRQKLQMQQNQQQIQPYPAISGASTIIDMSDAYRHNHPPPRPEPVFYNNSNPVYSNDQLLYNKNTVSLPGMMLPLPPPMFGHQPSSSLFTAPPMQQQQQQFMSPFRQPQLGQQSSNPSLMPSMMPLLPPLPRPFRMTSDKFAKRRDCFGISLCSCLWTLILIAFSIGGVALIVIAKVIGDKCAASSDYAESNKALCTRILHDGFMYGGITIAGLSAIVVLWRVVQWSCGQRGRT